MPRPDSADGTDGKDRRKFATTHWSLVVAAADLNSSSAQDALAALCESYWYPVYAFVRRQGHDVAAAEDLTQEFFCRVVEKNTLRAATRERGRFRSFLLASVKHFLCNEWDRANAAKRGGKHTIVSLDARDDAEDRFRSEPHHSETPEKEFERAWALALLDRTFVRLRAEAGRTAPDRYARFEPFLTEHGGAPYRQVAEELAMSESAVKVAVHRLRRRFGAILREEVALTIGTRDDVQDEIRQLLSVVGLP